ncbi:hypothetical protein GCM10022408_32660 [Hymenobacter fastidiosus]|uniref:Secretion system C-terminal sorting domain-containing protein n=1 Tax=Hymenobacter fastidiosus TaxID=486264 RepID=A0ABP7SUA1_9BACT
MKQILQLWFLLLALVPLGATAQVQYQHMELSNGQPQLSTPASRKADALWQASLAAKTANSVAAPCATTTTLDFGTNTGDWKNRTPVNAGGGSTNTTISTAGTYQEPGTGTETILTTGTNGGVFNTTNGTPLSWQADYATLTTTANPALTSTQITYNFNRPVNNFEMNMQDIDFGAGSFVDGVTLNAVLADGTVLNLSSAADAEVTNNTTYNTLTGNLIRGILASDNLATTASVKIVLLKPIIRLQIIYQNLITGVAPGNQYIAIDYMKWCTQANVATTLSGPARAIPTSQVTYTVTTTASGDFGATGVQPKVQLSADLNSQSPVFPTGSSYNNATGLLTLATVPTLAVGASSTSLIRFNMPATPVTGTASCTIDTDDAAPADNNGSLAAAKVTTTVNQSPTAQLKSATVSPNTAVFTALPAMTGTDQDNDPLTFTIVGTSIPATGFGTVSYTNNGTRVAVAGSSNVTLTAAQATTLEFRRGATATPTSATFQYFVSDPFGGVSPNVNYALTVADQPAVYSSPNVFTTTATINNYRLATVTDPDGTITTATRFGSNLPSNLFFATTALALGNGQNAFTVAAGTFYGDNKNAVPAGTYSFTVTTSGPGTTTTIPVTIKIIASDTEAAYSTANTYNRDALTSGSSLATVTDADGPVTNATLNGTLFNGMSFNATTGQFTVNSTSVPLAGTYTYSVTTTDIAGGTTTINPVTITIVDDVEAVYSVTQSFNRDALATSSSLATVTDADGAVTSGVLSAGALPAGIALNATTGLCSVSNTSECVNGNYSFTVSTVDNKGGKSILAVGVNLFETEAVYTAAPAKTGPYANDYTLATVSDADGTITNAVLSNSTLPTGVGFDAATGRFRVADRNLIKTGTYPMQVQTTDNTGGLSLSGFNINVGSSPLPVELTVFEAKAVGRDARLSWTTASEKNNDHFTVERSISKDQFEAIGTIQGHGTSTQSHSYSFIDAGIGTRRAGVAYYRLQQVDTDGTTSLSPVRALSFASENVAAGKLELYPNPATDNTTVDLTALAAGSYQVTLVDATGRTLSSNSYVAGAVHKLDMQRLLPGTYLVLVRGQGIKIAKTLVKQ